METVPDVKTLAAARKKASEWVAGGSRRYATYQVQPPSDEACGHTLYLMEFTGPFPAGDQFQHTYYNLVSWKSRDAPDSAPDSAGGPHKRLRMS